MQNQAEITKQSTPVMATYNRFPITLVNGKESYVWDDEGLEYLDFTSGIAACNLGHSPQYVKDRLIDQMNGLWHCSNLYHIPAQEKLAEALVNISCGDQVFFCNSGAEANEAAIKLARKYSQLVLGNEDSEIITFTQSFHGRTLGALSATGQQKIKDGFSPLVKGFKHLPFNDLDGLDEIDPQKTCAVLLELVQGEGGVVPADEEWLQKLASICRKNNLLLMADEVQTGIGRTGAMFAYEHYGIEPDVLVLAKGLGSGIPIGAIVAKKHVASCFTPGTHGTTFGGNPLASTAGLATLEYIQHEKIVEHAGRMGEYFHKRLSQLAKEVNGIAAVRGKGLLLGLETENAMEIVKQAHKHHLLLLPAGPNVVRILPPLTVNIEEIDKAMEVLKTIFKKHDQS
ncbi:aspartate aminotransferase family protein [Falsibacillus albus]|uniref:Acetylornithine aminotransferase n=1 Tax=Falsibacillus albus TaxID=2478915 RepID=A0A3L7JYW6_9BACI|nr:aspartate aminotransferase family protein [Falsibacillus albus]RLQ96078.1 aspartate aminotransferase family protein [Falsibacillus albus]